MMTKENHLTLNSSESNVRCHGELFFSKFLTLIQFADSTPAFGRNVQFSDYTFSVEPSEQENGLICIYDRVVIEPFVACFFELQLLKRKYQNSIRTRSKGIVG